MVSRSVFLQFPAICIIFAIFFEGLRHRSPLALHPPRDGGWAIPNYFPPLNSLNSLSTQKKWDCLMLYSGASDNTIKVWTDTFELASTFNGMQNGHVFLRMCRWVHSCWRMSIICFSPKKNDCNRLRQTAGLQLIWHSATHCAFWQGTQMLSTPSWSFNH